MNCCDHIDPNKPGDKSAQDDTAGRFYACPMHPEVTGTRPGMCSECGMALVPTGVAPKKKEHARGGHEHHDGHDEFNKHEGHHTESFLKKFWIAIILTFPVLLYSDLPTIFFGWTAPQFAGVSMLTLLLGSIVFFYCGWIFLSSAYREIRARLPGMMTLIALAITTAYLYSVYETFIGEPHTLWWELSTLIAVMLLGHWIEMRAVQGAQGALRELAKLLPDTAEVLRGVASVTVLTTELVVGDIVLVRPGSKVPADGKIIEGRSQLNESLITGESKPIEKTIGSEVIAGSLNGDGGIKVRVTKIGAQTFLSGVMRLVADAQASKSRLQVLSDRAALALTFIAVGAGAVTVVAWLSLGASVSTAVERLVAVLVIACPHALGLAIPLVSSISTTMGARNGLLIRERLALESARKVDIVLFDKTGTLTKGEFGVVAVLPAKDHTAHEVMKFAASVEAHSEHPIGKALVAAAQVRGVTFFDVKDSKRVPGMGATATIDGMEVFVGNEQSVKSAGIVLPSDYILNVEELSRQGKTVVHVTKGAGLIGGIALADVVRPESKEAITMLKALGVKTAMATGDSEDVAKWVAEELGIDEYFAKVFPGEKSEKVKALRRKGLKVAMVGDGVNDAPALAEADLGIAIGAGTNVAIESAGIVLVRSDPRDIPKIIRLSELTYSKMIQNLWWATGYNILAIPLAAGVLSGYGIFLGPAVSAAFMSLSTVIVSVNAVLLRRKQL